MEYKWLTDYCLTQRKRAVFQLSSGRLSTNVLIRNITHVYFKYTELIISTQGLDIFIIFIVPWPFKSK
jgi:hypothetical protein